MNAGFLSRFIGGANAVQTNNEDDTSKTNNPNNTNKDNNQNNIDNPTNIWETPTKSDVNANNQQQQQNFSQQQQQQQIDPDQAWQKHLASLKLTDGIDFAKLQQDFNAGDMESVNKAFETIGANSYKAAMLQMNKIVDGKLDALKQETLNESKATMNADLAVREMNSALPFTSDPNIAPVAKAVLNQFIKGGKDLPAAIKSTAEFFKSTASKVNANGTPPSNQNNSNFSQQRNFDNNNSNENRSEHDEWLDLLSA